MKMQISDMTIRVANPIITTSSTNYRVPSWPPPREWPVVIDKAGVVISRWGDSKWILTPWCKRSVILNFDYGGVRLPPLSSENAHLTRLIATLLIWGPTGARKVETIKLDFDNIRKIVALCDRNGISADKLMRFPKVYEQLPSIIEKMHRGAISMFHFLFDARGLLGFTIIAPETLMKLVAATQGPDHVQTPYIPPRIWLYQVTRLRECLQDFISHKARIEACFHFCLDVYVKHYGTLEAATAPGRTKHKRGPFNHDVGGRKRSHTLFPEVAARFGIAELLAKWIPIERGPLTIRDFSRYLTNVTYAGLMYIANFTLQRREEVAAIRSDCLIWEVDEQLGRVPIICGETTKTSPDTDARWVASPSVETAVQATSCIAHLRMICDKANPIVKPASADIEAPYLLSRSAEPWATSPALPYTVRPSARTIADVLENSSVLDPEQLRITAEDLEIARRLTPNLPESEFAVGKIWPLAWHQYRRTGVVNMFASGDISDSTMQQLLKHSTRLMSIYYGSNHSSLHFNNEVRSSVLMAMYQAQAEMAHVAVTSDRFISPHSPESKKSLEVNVLSAKDNRELIAMAKKGLINFREHRLGGCMKAGACEYGGIESVARCAGGDGAKPCSDVLYDRAKEPQVRADLRRISAELKMLAPEQPRHKALVEERIAMENYLNAVTA